MGLDWTWKTEFCGSFEELQITSDCTERMEYTGIGNFVAAWKNYTC